MPPRTRAGAPRIGRMRRGTGKRREWRSHGSGAFGCLTLEGADSLGNSRRCSVRGASTQGQDQILGTARRNIDRPGADPIVVSKLSAAAGTDVVVRWRK